MVWLCNGLAGMKFKINFNIGMLFCFLVAGSYMYIHKL